MYHSANVWGNKYGDRFVKVQTQAMQFFLGVGKVCPNAALSGETGWRPVIRGIEEVVLKYWFRLCSMEGSRLTGKVLRKFMNIQALMSAL